MYALALVKAKCGIPLYKVQDNKEVPGTAKCAADVETISLHEYPISQTRTAPQLEITITYKHWFVINND